MTVRNATLLADDTLDFLGHSDALIDISSVNVGMFGGAATLPKTALFLTETGDNNAISMSDIHQGQIGDCFLLSPIGDLAATHPDFIKNMVHVNANGTETVTLYTALNGSKAPPGETRFKANSVTVTNDFYAKGVNNAANQDVVNGQKEIWAQVLEKAAAQLGGGANYSSIANGGNPAMAMEEITGHTATYMSPADVTAAKLQAFANAGELITFDTKSTAGLGFNLVGGHAYMFNGIVSTPAGSAVSLSNPWGTYQPSAIPIAKLSSVFCEVDVGRVA